MRFLEFSHRTGLTCMVLVYADVGLVGAGGVVEFHDSVKRGHQSVVLTDWQNKMTTQLVRFVLHHLLLTYNWKLLIKNDIQYRGWKWRTSQTKLLIEFFIGHFYLLKKTRNAIIEVKTSLNITLSIFYTYQALQKEACRILFYKDILGVTLLCNS